jgi:hypothetical protein
MWSGRGRLWRSLSNVRGPLRSSLSTMEPINSANVSSEVASSDVNVKVHNIYTYVMSVRCMCCICMYVCMYTCAHICTYNIYVIYM